MSIHSVSIDSGDLMHLHEALDIAQTLAEWSRGAHLATDADRTLAALRIAAYTRLRVAITDAIIADAHGAPGHDGHDDDLRLIRKYNVGEDDE